MTVRLGRIEGTGACAFLHTCEECGVDASFGINVSYRAALNAVDKGKFELAKELLGKWYCLTHWRKLNGTN